MILPAAHDLHDVIDQVTATLFGARGVVPDPAPPRDPLLWIGAVDIAGPFAGTVSVACTPSFARAAALTLVGELDSDDELVADCLAELANIYGGNVKSLFATATGPCQLSLPRVATDAAGPTAPAAAATDELAARWFAWGGTDDARMQISVTRR